MTKLDILDGLDEIKIGASYKLDGKELTTPPGNTSELTRVQVEYVTMPGWKQNISKCRRFEDLPQAAQEYVHVVEQLCEVPGESPLVCAYLNHMLTVCLICSQMDWRRSVSRLDYSRLLDGDWALSFYSHHLSLHFTHLLSPFSLVRNRHCSLTSFSLNIDSSLGTSRNFSSLSPG